MSHGIAILGPWLWNWLPFQIASSLPIFKSLLKTYLFSLVFDPVWQANVHLFYLFILLFYSCLTVSCIVLMYFAFLLYWLYSLFYICFIYLLKMYFDVFLFFFFLEHFVQWLLLLKCFINNLGLAYINVDQVWNHLLTWT